MELIIITPEEELYSGSIKSIKVPGTQGQFQILKGHAPIVSSLEKGTITVVDMAGGKHEFRITQGYVEVLRDEVNCMVVSDSEEETS